MLAAIAMALWPGFCSWHRPAWRMWRFGIRRKGLGRSLGSLKGTLVLKVRLLVLKVLWFHEQQNEYTHNGSTTCKDRV